MKKAEFFYHNPKAPKPNKPNLIGATILIEYNPYAPLGTQGRQRAVGDYRRQFGNRGKPACLCHKGSQGRNCNQP